MGLRGRMRWLEKQAARLQAQRWEARRAEIHAMTLEQRALGILDLFECARRRAGRPIPNCLARLRVTLATAGPEAAAEASKVLAFARQIRGAKIGNEGAH